MSLKGKVFLGIKIHGIEDDLTIGKGSTQIWEE